MKDEIIHFLEKNLIGKILFTDKVTYTLGNGKLEGIYNDQMTFSNLVKTENGFKFNMTTLTHELIYNLDEEGAKTTVAAKNGADCYSKNGDAVTVLTWQS